MLEAPSPPGNGFTLEPNLLNSFPSNGETKTIGTFSQWEKLTYWLESPDDTIWYSRTFCDNGFGGIVNSYPLQLSFYVCPPPMDCPSDIANVGLDVYMVPDSSRAQFPSQDVLDDWNTCGGPNPYIGNPDAIIALPFEGTYRLVITGGASNGHDDLKLILPNDTTLLTSAQSHIGDTLILGPYTAGTQIQFAITSHAAPIVEGMKLYPQMVQYGVSTWQFWTENWTDLDWGDLSFNLEYNSGVADQLELLTIPSEVEYGDTVSLIIRAVDSNGEFVPLDSTYQFTITLLDTVGYGSLIYNNEVGTTFTVQGDSGVGKWFRYAATGVIPEDSVVEIPFHLVAINHPISVPALTIALNGGRVIESVTSNTSSHNLVTHTKNSITNLRSLQSIDQPDTIENNNNMSEKKRDILLGETKYYYLKFYENSGQYEIEESSTPNATGEEGVQFSVERLPVYAARPNEKPDGIRCGVYYEYRNSEGVAIENQIRLIGRYWHEESKYVVKLSAKIGDEVKGTAIIEVKKPDVLGDPNLTDSARHTLIKDVKGHDLWLDEVIFGYSGEWGIPPQMIKGQIEKETQFRNLFLYEPFQDIFIQMDKLQKRNFIVSKEGTLLPFVVDGNNNMGGDFPSGHSNVSPTDYERSPLKISQFLEDHLGRYVNRTKVKLVYDNDYANDLTKDLKEFYTYSLEIGLTVKDAADFAIEIVENKFHDQEYSDVYNNLYAQTRISTSYGLIQMLYKTAVGSSFKETGSKYGVAGSKFMNRIDPLLPPEKLNEYDYLFGRYIDFTLQHLRITLGGEDILPDHEWNDGYESVWVYTFQKHNPGDTKNQSPLYGLDVLAKSKSYSPKLQGK